MAFHPLLWDDTLPRDHFRMFGRINIDLKKQNLIEEAGFRSPEHRLTALSDKVQEAVRSAFGDLMPRIRQDEDGRVWYENFDEESRETLALSRALEPGEPWPEHEALRFIEGWEALRVQAETESDPNLGSFLLNLVVPDPVTRTNCYRVYRDVNGIPRLHVLWGTVAKDSKHQSLPTARVCEMVRTGLTTAVHTVRPATRAVGLPVNGSTATVTPPDGPGAHPLPTQTGAHDVTAWLRPLAILLTALAISMVLFEWEDYFSARVPVAPLPQNIHLGPENRALLGDP